MISSAQRFFPKLTMVKGGVKIPVEFNAGDRLFDAVENTPAADLRGPCGGNMACGACHCVVPKELYTEPSEDEKEVLENVDGLTKTSRLGCQLVLTEKFDGCEIVYSRD